MKNNYTKIIKIISVNIFVFLFLWFIFDIALYSLSIITYGFPKKQLFQMYQIKGTPRTFIEDCFSDEKPYSAKIYKTRKPVGTEFKADPILIFGCSFAYGMNLEDNQTFSTKLSKLTKRPVYNYAICGKSFQQMFFITESEEFYKKVPPCSTVIYVMIEDHFKRLLGDPFFLCENNIEVNYKYKNKKLVVDNFDNPFVAFYKIDYTIRAIRRMLGKLYVNNEANNEQMTDEALAYFIKTRENLNKHWKNNPRIILFAYLPYNLSYNLIDKLKKENFEVITTQDLTEENLENTENYMQENWHPTEAAWDLLTPLFIKKMQENKQNPG